MADHQAITQSIRATLRSGVRGRSDELADLAAGYTTLCRDANLRLRRCLEYVRGGYVTEAAHLSMCQPDLGALVSALQFPEGREWADLCATYNLSRAPAVLDGMDEIKAALKSERSLAPLLARHRLLAIARAPIAERLQVVRLLVRHDSANPLWPTEARELESVRLAELSKELAGATETGDREAMGRIWTELSAHSWTVDLPENLRDGLDAVENRQRQARAAAEMTDLAAQLLVTDAALDGARRRAVERWQTLLKENPDGLSQESIDRVQQVIEGMTLQDAKRREAEEVQLQEQLFRPAEGASSNPYLAFPPTSIWRSRIALWTALLLVLAGGFVTYLLKFPEHATRIRSFLFGGG